MLYQPKHQLIEDEEVSACKSCRARPCSFLLLSSDLLHMLQHIQLFEVTIVWAARRVALGLAQPDWRLIPKSALDDRTGSSVYDF